jgi:hypothetical protein
MAIATLGRTHNFGAIVEGVLLSLKDYSGITFYCSGDDTFTLASAATYDGDTTDLATITDYVTNASTAGADQWVDATQAAADNVVIASGMAGFFVDASDLPAGAQYVSVTHSSAGLVYAVLGDLLPGRDPAKLRPISGANS